MNPDFPAAHSMDTTWFAVDKCGHVAVFDSGEDGAVPVGAPDAYDSFSSEQPFPGELDRCLRQNQIMPGFHGAKIQEAGPDKRPSFAPGFYLLGPGINADRSRIRKAEVPGYAWIVDPAFGTTDGRDWVEGALSVDSWAWLHAAPHRCLGCTDSFPVDFPRRMDELGIFRYDCDTYGNTPYEREGNPYTPATLDSLRTRTGRLIPHPPRFPGFCFRDKFRIQPIQWTASRTYSDVREWVDEAGNVRTEGGNFAE